MSDNGIPQLIGLASASFGGSFTTNGNAVALIFDAMTAAWNQGGAERERMRSAAFSLVASPEARARTIRLTLSGFAQPPGAGALALQLGDASQKVQPAEESYSVTASATLSAESDITPVIVTLDLPKPADDSAAMLGLDSIDIFLPDG